MPSVASAEVKKGAIGHIIKIVELVAAFGIFVMMGHILANVAGRFFFNKPLIFTQEIVGYVYLPIVALLGMMVAKYLNEHLQAPLIFDQLTWGNRRILVMISTFLVTAVCLLFVWFTFEEALHGFLVKATGGVTTVQIWPVLWLVPITFFFLAVFWLAEGINAARGRLDVKNEEEMAEDFLASAESKEGSPS